MEQTTSKTRDENFLTKRRYLYFHFIYLYFTSGLDRMFTHTSLWYYIHNDIDSTNYYFNYQLILSGCYVMPLIVSIPLSKWFDKNRPLKKTAIIMTLVNSIGYVFYFMPFSPYYPFIGVILTGISYVMRGIMNSEMILLFETSDLPNVFLMGTAMYGVGQTLAPIILMLAAKLHSSIGPLPVTYGNIQAFVLLGTSLIRLFGLYFFCHDLSKLSTKSDENKEDSNKNNDEESSNDNEDNETSTSKDVKIDSCILIFQQFIVVALGLVLAPVLPLIVDYLGYDKQMTAWIMFADSVVLTILSYIGKRMKISEKGIYYSGILVLLLLIIDYFIMGVVMTLRSSSLALNISLLGMYVFCRKLSWLCEMTYVPVTLGKINSKSQQTFLEGMRVTSKHLGSVVSGVLAPYLFKYYAILLPVFGAFLFIFMLVIFIRKKTLMLKPTSESTNEEEENPTSDSTNEEGVKRTSDSTSEKEVIA